jgi:hypothetical protein
VKTLARAAAIALALAVVPCAAPAAELTGLIGKGGGPDEGPGELADWGTCYGGMLTITLFNIVHGEVEGIYNGSDLADTNLMTLNGKAYLGPSIGRFVPYAGVGAGVYNLGRPVDDDQGTVGLVFAGAKLKFPFGLVIRGEYQWMDMPDAAPVRLDHRYFFALGLGF